MASSDAGLIAGLDASNEKFLERNHPNWSHSSVGQSVRLITVRSAARARVGQFFLHLPGRQTQEKNSFFGKRQARTRRRSFKKDPARDTPIAMTSTDADAFRASRLHDALEKLKELCNRPSLNIVLIVQWLARRVVAATSDNPGSTPTGDISRMSSFSTNRLE